MYGQNCMESCLCMNNAQCHHINGSCTCLPGWIGQHCEIPCPAGTYGDGCTQNCTCMNGGVCDAATGLCRCTPGWIGDTCSSPCDGDAYGEQCLNQCLCVNSSPCDHVTGTTLFFSAKSFQVWPFKSLCLSEKSNYQ